MRRNRRDKTIRIDLSISRHHIARSPQFLGIVVAIILIATGGYRFKSNHEFILRGKGMQQCATYQCFAYSGISACNEIAHRESLKIQLSSLCGVAHKKLLLTYNTYAAAQFFARALPSL
jgi:hypothetical protein